MVKNKSDVSRRELLQRKGSLYANGVFPCVFLYVFVNTLGHEGIG